MKTNDREEIKEREKKKKYRNPVKDYQTIYQTTGSIKMK
jgi:hypothetical protein